jgi:restriction endonuclease Mrr
LVEESMRASLTPADRETLPSGQRERWREDAEWERYYMGKEGLLAGPNGIWEITDVGREYLASNCND